VEASIHLDFGEGCHIEVGVRQLYGVANCRVVSEKGITPEQLQTINLHRSVWVPSSVGIVRDEEYKTAARLTGLIGAGRTNEVLRNLLLDLHQHQEPRFDQVQRVLDERFGASLGAVEFDGEADQFVRVDYTAASATHDLFSAGSGFLQVLQLLTYVLRRDASVVLLDEPDAHLHSHMQRLVIEVLEDLAGSAGFQVVLATHSKEIINFVDPSRLIFIDHGSTSVGPGVSAGPVAILRALGDIDNVDAFTLFKNRRCLFIEGKGDTAVLSRWARLLGNRAFVGDDSVVAISVGGADRFEHVAQLQVMENLLGAPLQSLELRDRDAMIEETRAERMRGAVRPLHIWQRDSIESYLLDPAVLARLVGELTDGKCAQTASDIEALAMECCDAVRDETVDRVSNRYSMDRARDEARHPTIPEANRVAREAVDAAWPTLESRLTLVSGKRLLGAVRERLQALCGVSFGNERLADAFTAAEVPDEVREALRRVEVLATARP
jgi:energy-coupling factor transporter ATP-binding protein EcfA2